MYITNNGIFITRKTWRALTSIQYFGLQPSTGTVQIDMFHFNKDREVDRYILFVDASAEKFLYHRITDKTFGTCEQHLRVTANTLGDLYRGVDTLEVMKEIELGWDNAGTFTNINLHDIAIQPFTGLLYGIDDTHLYIFDPHDELPDYSGMKVSDPGTEMVPQSDYVDYIIDDAATLTPFWRSPNTRIYANRWHVTKPDGTQVYILMDGSEVSTATAAAGWIYNKGYTEVAFGPFDNGSGELLDKQRIEITLDQRGTWLVTLEVLTVDSTRYESCIPLHVHSKTALVRLPLPVALAGATGIAFDSSQRLWLLSSTTANMIDLAADTMLVDFNKKVVYLHESYDSVTVYPSEDITD